MRNTAKKQSRGRERHREQDTTEAISANVAHSAARLQSMLCRSTTYRAHQLIRWRGLTTRPAGGGVVVDGTASAAADRSAQFTTPSWQKENWRTATQGWALARPPSPTRSTSDPRVRTRCVPGSCGKGRGCGRQSRMSGERQAVCARRVVVRRPKGVGRGVATPHEVGTNTRNEIANRC
jgi:hypothetical protein